MSKVNETAVVEGKYYKYKPYCGARVVVVPVATDVLGGLVPVKVFEKDASPRYKIVESWLLAEPKPKDILDNIPGVEKPKFKNGDKFVFDPGSGDITVEVTGIKYTDYGWVYEAEGARWYSEFRLGTARKVNG